MGYLLTTAPAAAATVDGQAMALLSQPLVVGLGIGALVLTLLAGPLLLWQRWQLERAAARGAKRDGEILRLNEILLSAPDGFFRWNPDGREQCSRRLAVLLGLIGGTDATFREVLEAFGPAEAASLESAVEGLRGTGEGFELELPLGDGQRRVLIRGLRAATAEGRPLADVLWMRDVSAASQALESLSGEAANLAAERDRLKALIDMLPVPVWLRDDDLAITYCNRTYANAVEAETAGEAVRRGLELVPANSVREARALAARARAAGTPRSGSFHLVVGGARRLVEVTELPMHAEEDGERELLTAGFAFDMTRQEELQNELNRHVAAHAQVLENLQTAIAVFDGDTRLTFRNKAFQKLWRLEDGQLEDRPTYGALLDELRERRLLPEVADYPAFREEELKRFVSLIDPVEDLLHLPDGTTLRRTIAAHPFGGLVYTYEDVTDTLALERSYNTLIAVQRETLDNLHEGVAVFGADGRLRLSNPAFARIWQLDPQDLGEERHVADIVESHRRFFTGDIEWEHTRDAILSLFNDRQPRHGRIERADGTILDFASVPLPDGATLITWLDVTDPARVERALRERNEALREANRLKSEFIASVSAEVRTPLTTIIGFSDMLAGDYFGKLNKRQQEYARGIRDAGQSLMALINDILDLAAVEAGQMALELDAFDIHNMLTAVLSLIRERVREKAIRLTFDCDIDIGWMVADERRLKQVIFNLLSNAVKFTPKRGQVALSARREGDQVVFVVRDTGIGIAEDEQSSVFTRFVRGNQPEARQEGAGLGLSLVKSFVELHGGTVALSSRRAEGTTVTVRLPAGEADGAAPA